MANLKSSKKDIKRIAAKTEANKSVRTALKTYVKKVRTAVESGDKEKIQAAVKEVCSRLDKAAARGIIHKNQADRRKSRITKLAASAGK